MSGQGSRWVWTYYVKQGKLVRDKGLDRGNLLVMTEEEWRERYDVLLKKAMWTVSTLIGIVIGIGFIIFMALVLFTFPEDQMRDSLIAFFLMLTLLFVFVPFISLYQNRQRAKKLPAPGLYEYGLQQSPYGFIPYTEIASTERTAVGWPKKKDVVVMNPWYQRKALGIKIRTPWNILIEFIGEEGAKELEARVRGDIGPHGPPDLHIYGTYK